MKKILMTMFVAASLTASGCGDDDGGPGAIDAPVGGAIDADPAAPDADPAAPDADPTAPDAPIGGTPDAPVGGGPDASPGGIACGAMMCTGGEQCCVEMAGGMTTSTCIPAADPCGGTAITCDGPEDCGGNACCGEVIGMMGTASCSTGDTCMGGGTSVELCHTPADCSTTTNMCCPVPMSPGSGYCSSFPMCF